MSEYFVVWKYQARLFLRNKLLLFGVFVLLLAALFAAGYGKHFVQQQNSVIYIADTAQKALQAKWKESYKGSTLHYTYLAQELAVYRPTPMASLAIGQKDNYPFYHLTGVAEYIYGVTSTEIHNPLKLLAGNFDLSYVFIYLFPLFIIVFGYNVFSEEKENSTYTLLRIQGNTNKIILNKLVFRMLVMLLLSLAANALAFALNGIKWSENGTTMLAWSLVTIIYIIFWFALVYLIVSLRWSGGITALTLSGLWVLLLFLVPSVIHKNVSRPLVKEQVQSIFSKRGDMQRPRKMDSATQVNAFRKLQLPYTLTSRPDTGKMGQEVKELIAFEVQAHQDHEIGKKPIQQQAAEYQQTLAWNWINPVFAVQNTYNQIAGTEINNYHCYLDAVDRHQTKKRYEMHAALLSGKPVTWEMVERMPRLQYKPMSIDCGKALQLMLPVLALAAAFILAGFLNTKHK